MNTVQHRLPVQGHRRLHNYLQIHILLRACDALTFFRRACGAGKNLRQHWAVALGLRPSAALVPSNAVPTEHTDLRSGVARDDEHHTEM